MPLDSGTALAVTAAAVSLTLGLFSAIRRLLRGKAGARALAERAALGRDAPLSLHPVIDADRCIGSLSCLKSCPEGGILGVVEGAARLVHGEQCVGHGRCAAACPVEAIELVFGTARRGIDLPDLSGTFESSRAGVHVVGELGGMGLVRNAMRQGLECAGYLAEALGPGARAADAVDVLIAGAGPAGLATALGARQAGLSYRLVEQSTLGGTVASYPRQKVVMTEPILLPFHGRFGKRRLSKEELLDAFRRLVARAGLIVEEKVKVEAIEGADGAFEVRTSTGERIRARKVVLAVGRRGTPRRLGVPGEELEKVTYTLADPEQYDGRRVLVVGGGDSALEAAQALVAAGARVVLSYRGDALARCRAENRSRVERLAAEGRLELLLASEVRSVEPRQARVEVGGQVRAIDNDYVLVSIGGELPLDFLRKVGVELRSYFGEAPGAPRRGAAGLRPAPEGAHPKLAELARDRPRRRRERRLALALAAAGAAVVLALAWHGRHYYPLDALARRRSPLHATLRPAGPWGHGLGLAAAACMLSNFLYAARKRLRFLELGDIRSWLQFHVFAGFLAPCAIAFHAAFQSRNLLATSTAGALLVVVLTGLVGRYVYGLIQADGGRAQELEELQGRLVRLRDQVQPLLAASRDPERVRALFLGAAAPARGGPLLLLLLALPFRRARVRAALLRARPLFDAHSDHREFHDACLRVERLRIQIGFYRSLKRFLRAWRALHATLAVFLLLAMAAHVAVSLYLGYGWLRLR